MLILLAVPFVTESGNVLDRTPNSHIRLQSNKVKRTSQDYIINVEPARHIKIQPKLMDFITRLWEITTEFVEFLRRLFAECEHNISQNVNVTSLVQSLKADFQSVLRTLERLLMFFCFGSCKTSQNVNIWQLLTFK